MMQSAERYREGGAEEAALGWVLKCVCAGGLSQLPWEQMGHRSATLSTLSVTCPFFSTAVHWLCFWDAMN